MIDPDEPIEEYTAEDLEKAQDEYRMIMLESEAQNRYQDIIKN